MNIGRKGNCLDWCISVATFNEFFLGVSMYDAHRNDVVLKCFHLRHIAADEPGLKLLLQIQQHGAYNCCDKCVFNGVKIVEKNHKGNDGGVVKYPPSSCSNAIPRTRAYVCT